MRYLLKIKALGNFPEVNITKPEFDELGIARTALSAGLALEEKYEILISNYLLLEKEILSLSAETMVRPEITYKRMSEYRVIINRMLINLLTTARLYKDSFEYHIEQVIGKELSDDIRKIFCPEYDAHFDFRFMEALRNYVQHRGFPTNKTGFFLDRKEIHRRDFVFSFEFVSCKQDLAEDGKFKKPVLDECPDKIDLKAASRNYIESFSRVHKKIRNLMSPFLDDYRGKVEAAIARYKQIYGQDPIGMEAIEQDDANKCVHAIPLLLDWEKIRQELVERNRLLVNLGDRCVSSAIRGT